MPIPGNPRKRDFFVYQFEAGDYPFYVGIGRGERDTDRLRYVKSLMGPKNRAKLAKKSLSVRVMACLLKRDIEVRRSRTKRHINRRQALIFEKEQIARLLAKGFMLANWQHNPYRHKDPSRAVRAILSKKLRPG